MTTEVPWRTIPQMLRGRAAETPDAVLVSDPEGGVTLTAKELLDRALTVARSLRYAGVEPGDRVAIWAPNDWQWIVTVFGIWETGAAVVPLSTRFKGFEAGDLLERTGTRVLFAAEGFLGASYVELLAQVYGGPIDGRPFAELENLNLVVSLGTPAPRPGVEDYPTFLGRPTLGSPTVAPEGADSVRPESLCEVLSTSGTTGTPKGVMLDHQQLLRAYWDWSEVADLRAGDRYPVVSPFAHGFGINAGIVACVMRGATIVPIALFDPSTALDLIEREQVSLIAGPPTLFSRLLSDPELPSRDVSSLRVAIVGAAAVPEELVHAMRDRLGLERIVNAYGLIEGSVVTMTRPEDSAAVVARTAGRVMPGMEILIVGDQGRPLSPGERGEILVRGYGVTRGYWDAPQLTAEALDRGWLHTGDVGVVDNDGNLMIVGRKKDMFIVGGFNAYPAEIENLLLRHPAVAQAAVVAIPHPELGEVGCAFVVPEPGVDVRPDEVVQWSRQNMSNYKVPRHVAIVRELPVSANGKVDKAALHRTASRQTATAG